MKKILLVIILTIALACTACSKKAAVKTPAGSGSENKTPVTQVLDDLSDELDSFQLQIDDEIYTMPMKYSDFVSYGFEMNEDDSDEIEPGYYGWASFNQGDLKIESTVINADKKTRSTSKCYVGGIEIKNKNENGKDAFIALPKGIIFNKSTLDDVLAAYGEPSKIYELSTYTMYVYEFGINRSVTINIGKESGIVDSFEVRNLLVK